MGDKVSEAAGRVVDRLSRRRFIGWVGKGGLVLGAGLGFDALRSDAFAQPHCKSIKPAPIPILETSPRTFTLCVRAGTCEGQVGRALDRFCAREADLTCLPGTCPRHPRQLCEASGLSADHVASSCRSLGQQDCAVGEEKCVCTVEVKPGFRMGKVTCQCGCNPV